MSITSIPGFGPSVGRLSIVAKRRARPEDGRRRRRSGGCLGGVTMQFAATVGCSPTTRRPRRRIAAGAGSWFQVLASDATLRRFVARPRLLAGPALDPIVRNPSGRGDPAAAEVKAIRGIESRLERFAGVPAGRMLAPLACRFMDRVVRHGHGRPSFPWRLSDTPQSPPRFSPGGGRGLSGYALSSRIRSSRSFSCCWSS